MTFEAKTYRLTTLSPIHIGCDHVYEPTSFVVKNDESKLISFDPLHFLQSLESEDVEKFSALCKQGNVESLLDIYKFINNKAQGMEGVAVEVGQDFLNHYQSVLEKPRHKIEAELNSFLINRTAFNPLTGSVYIPGSAFKGSLRTAILNARHKEKPLPGSYMQRNGNRQFQKDILDGGEFQTDPFSRVKISDFKPVSEIGRRIVYAVDCKKKPEKGETVALYQIFEVIMPGAVFEGSVSIEQPHSKAGIKRPVSFSEVEEALTIFFGKEKDREAKEIAVIGASSIVHEYDQRPLLRLGRHSGAECVTVEGKRSIRIMIGRKGKSTSLDRATTIWFASDSRRPSLTTNLQPFGWLALHRATDDELVESLEMEEREKEKLLEKWRVARQKRKEAKLEREKQLERQRQVRLEQEKAEEEARKYPWRIVMRELKEIDDWGMFRQLVLDNENARAWQEVEEFVDAVFTTAEGVRAARPDKWGAERDELTAAWLEPSGKAWESSVEEGGQQAEESVLLKNIREYSEWGDFKQNPISPGTLDIATALALADRFREWGCDGKKVKKDKKKAWKDLQARIKQLK